MKSARLVIALTMKFLRYFSFDFAKVGNTLKINRKVEMMHTYMRIHLISLLVQVVNYLLRGWIKNLESEGSVALPLLDDEESIQYSIDKKLEFVREGSKKSVRVRFYGSRFSLWNKIGSYFRSPFRKLEIKSS